MSRNFDYTTSARRLWAKHPLLAFLSIQITFWIYATLLLGIILHLHSLQIGETAKPTILNKLKPVVLISVSFGALYAVIAGSATYFLEKHFYRTARLAIVVLLNTFASFAALALLLTLVRLKLTVFFILPYVERYSMNHSTWKYLFAIVVLYFFSMTLVINFINQLNRRYGRGILLPLVLGRYREPHEEERIFMFMDLKSSTSHAEKLGHLRYSAFIRDSFMDINSVVSSYDADIYQYVGDEIVLSWRTTNGIAKANCIMFFFACVEMFEKKSSYYLANHGMLPVFKAGMHSGKVVAVEIGDTKREIAYHGEVLHIGARIQGLCNKYQQQLIASATLLQQLKLPAYIKSAPLGYVSLRGKDDAIEIKGISIQEIF